VIVAIAVAGGIAVFVAWRLVARGRVSVWVAMGLVEGAAGVAALAARRAPLSPRVAPATAALAGLGAGVALYVATAAFVLVVRRWPVFDRHVAEIYDQRKGLSLPVALVVAAGVTAAGEELFWRGLVQGRLATTLGWTGAAIVTWAAYVLANAASRSLPILAGAVVSGAVWGALALWTHGVLASLLCHALWTALMLSFPPGGTRARRPEAGAGQTGRDGNGNHRPDPYGAAS
jgi:membrane protease YdiL (CAAX protease family)